MKSLQSLEVYQKALFQTSEENTEEALHTLNTEIEGVLDLASFFRNLSPELASTAPNIWVFKWMLSEAIRLLNPANPEGRDSAHLEALFKWVSYSEGDGLPMLRAVCEEIKSIFENRPSYIDPTRLRDLLMLNLGFAQNTAGFDMIFLPEFRFILTRGYGHPIILESPWYQGVNMPISPLQMVYFRGLEDVFIKLVNIKIEEVQCGRSFVREIRVMVTAVLMVLSRQDWKQPWKRMADRFFEHPDVKAETLKMVESNLGLDDEIILGLGDEIIIEDKLGLLLDMHVLAFLLTLELSGFYQKEIAGRINAKMKYLVCVESGRKRILANIPPYNFDSFNVRPQDERPPIIQPWYSQHIGIYRHFKVFYDGVFGGCRSAILANFKKDPTFALEIFNRMVFPFIEEVLSNIGGRHFWISMFRDATSPFSRFPNELKTILMEYFLVHLSIDCEVDHCIRINTTQFAKQCIERYPNANARIRALGYTGIPIKERHIHDAHCHLQEL